MERISIAFAFGSVLVTLLACKERDPAHDAAQWRGTHELECRNVHVYPRPDLSPVTYDVVGCGREARYTCRSEAGYGRYLGPMSCVPEVLVPGVTIGPPEIATRDRS